MIKFHVLRNKNGFRTPYFARSPNSNLFWVSLIEKAYAKLHKRYWAISNGTVEDALHDLTGIYPERFPIDIGNFTDVTKLYDAMKILTLSGALIGSALIYDRVEISEAQKEKEMKSALSKGIQPGVYYSVLDWREVELKETNNKTVRIVRVQNPWENAIEWNGDFCDDDKIWTPTMKTYFKSLSSNKENNRYVHEWYTDDGIFWIRTEDFASYFNNIYVVRDFPDNYEGVRYSSSWNPSFGYPHKKNVEWIKNAQYVFKVTDQKPVDFIFLLQQKDPRFISSNSPPYHSKLLKIGFIIWKIASTEDKLVFYHESKEIFRKEPVSKRFIHGLVTLPIGKYVVIPITENAGDWSYFQLKIFFDSDFINFITPGYKVILENEEAIDPIDKFKPFDGSKVDKISDRLHKGGKYDNVLSDISSMRVRTNKNSQIDKIMKQEIKSSAWASSILIPFNCDHMVNTLKVSEEFIKAGLTSKDSKTEPNSKIKKSMIDQMGRKRDNFKAFSEEIVNDQEEIVFSGSTNDHEFKQTAYGKIFIIKKHFLIEEYAYMLLKQCHHKYYSIIYLFNLQYLQLN